jgi:phage host-nuclease inhibitor protein Gam
VGADTYLRVVHSLLKGIIMIKRLKKTLTAIPASVAEAATYLVSIGEKQREINRVKRETKKACEDAKKKVEDLSRERNAFFTALFAFAQPRKAELTEDKRTQKTFAGTFGWRWTTPYVDLKEGKTDAQIIATLKRDGLTQYIRVVEELDREAMLRDRPEVAGVLYSQRDEFFAKPKLKKEDGRAEELVKITESIDT